MSVTLEGEQTILNIKITPEGGRYSTYPTLLSEDYGNSRFLMTCLGRYVSWRGNPLIILCAWKRYIAYNPRLNIVSASLAARNGHLRLWGHADTLSCP